MPRRCNESEDLVICKRKKVEECPSLDASFCDDEALTPGLIFTDVSQRKWRIGKPIGRGSFGRIYLASDDITKDVTKLNARYVVKIEPHSNGPLFVEVHCLIRTGDAAKVKTWRQQHKQKRLGMPHYIASGSFIDENTNTKYRFLVLPRYDIDLQKIISRTKVLDLKNVLIIAIQILDVLEYLHSQGYTHSDIKSSNLMLGFDGKNFKTQIKPTYEKDIKQPVILSRKPKKAKSTKPRTSNYYEDEDFTIKGLSDEAVQLRLENVRKKITKILTDKDRSILRNHAFNLRQLNKNINYEDSSICSDWSYQKLEDGKSDETNYKDLNEIYKEAIQSQSTGQVYLLDYGLASKFVDSEGNHKDFGMDARKAHDGTLEYSSRDSHIGAHSRRSDLETLGYNILDWLTGSLPWKTQEILSNPDLVHAVKKNFMADTKVLLKACFKTELYPKFLEKYLNYITSLDFTEKPDYDFCKSIFHSELLKNGYVLSKDLLVNFDEYSKSTVSRNGQPKGFGIKNTPPDFIVRNGIKKSHRENIRSIENGLKMELFKRSLNTSSDGHRKPCSSRNFFISDSDLVARLKKSLLPQDFGKKLSPKNLRSKKNIKRKGIRRHRNSIGKFGNFMGSARQFTWAEVLAGNPEDIIRKERNPPETFDDDSTCKYRIRKLSHSSDSSCLQSPLLQKDYLKGLNPTYAMIEVYENFKKKVSGQSKEPEETQNVEGYTSAMLKVLKSKEKRENAEKTEVVQKTVRQTRSMAKKSEVKIDKANKKEENISVEKIQENQESKTPRKGRSIKKNNKQKRNVQKPEETEKVSQNTDVTVQKNLPRRSCRLRNTDTEQNSIENKNNDKKLNICSVRRRSLRVVVKKLDLKDIPNIPESSVKGTKSPRKKAVPMNRIKLRSSNRKK